jgi:hypothetical protein
MFGDVFDLTLSRTIVGWDEENIYLFFWCKYLHLPLLKEAIYEKERK